MIYMYAYMCVYITFGWEIRAAMVASVAEVTRYDQTTRHKGMSFIVVSGLRLLSLACCMMLTL